MGIEEVEVKQEVTKVVKEKRKYGVCDVCGQEVGSAGRLYFGLPLEHLIEEDIGTSEARFEKTVLTRNFFVCCGNCDKVFQ